MGGIRIREEKLENILEKGEGRTIEFKGKDILSDKNKLAKEMVALANNQGGKIFIGIGDDKNLEWIKKRKETSHEEFLMNIARDKCVPPIAPDIETISKKECGNIYVLNIPKFREYPHALKTKRGKVFYIRVGSTVREASVPEIRKRYLGPYL